MAPKKKKEVDEVKISDSEIGQKTIDAALSSLKKKHGAVVGWLDNINRSESAIVSTGSIRLDAALGIGGIKLGRMYEFYGTNMSGKSTLALSIVREAVNQGHRVIYVDAEHALDDTEGGLLSKMGIDTSKIVFVRGYTAEQNLDITEALIATGEFSICVMDSVSALQPSSEANLTSFNDNLMGVHPRLMARMCRGFTPLAARTNCAVILINQIRANMSGYGSAETTSGGNAIPHFASVRLKVSGGGVKSRLIQDDNGNAVGQRTTVDIVKNKLAPPWRSADIDLIFGKGFDRDAEIFDLAVEMGFIDKAGSWYSYKEEKIGQGRDKGIAFLKENQDILESILEGVYTVLGMTPAKETKSSSGKNE